MFNEAFDVSRSGNWEDRNILQRVKDPDVLAYRQESSVAEIETRLDQLRQQLFDVRAQRPRPGLDDKVVTAWNGLMLAAFAEAARVLGRDDYRAAAVASAEFLQRELARPGAAVASHLERRPGQVERLPWRTTPVRRRVCWSFIRPLSTSAGSKPRAGSRTR